MDYSVSPWPNLVKSQMSSFRLGPARVKARPRSLTNVNMFPRLYAVDSSEHHSLNTQYGVMAVPSIFVFHNSRPLYKYNYTEYNLSSFTQFVSLLTGNYIMLNIDQQF